MSPYPLVSIIIPIYKVESFIERCLLSVLRQSYRVLEVILVDDCSPDKSMEIAKNFVKESPLSKDLTFVYLNHSRNRGLSAARNTGIDAATGDYMYFLDSDDYITEDCIATLVLPLNTFSYDIVVGNYKVIKNGIDIKPLPLRLKGEVMESRNIAETYLHTQLYSMAWNKLCNASFIRNKKLYFQEGLISEDELWTAQTACTAEAIYAEKRITYYYCLREGSLYTSMTQENMRNNYMRVLQYFYKSQEKSNWDIVASETVERRLKSIVNGTVCGLSPYKKYIHFRQCDVRSIKFKAKSCKTLKEWIQKFDQFLPCILGFIYKTFITQLRVIKYKLSTKVTL